LTLQFEEPPQRLVLRLIEILHLPADVEAQQSFYAPLDVNGLEIQIPSIRYLIPDGHYSALLQPDTQTISLRSIMLSVGKIMSADRSKWPALVRFSLLGLPNRASAWACVWLSLAVAAAGIAWGVFVDPLGLYAFVFVFAAMFYYLAIRWVDRHDRWS
jgi:hypothetical protein